jgi:hypothetical protein
MLHWLNIKFSQNLKRSFENQISSTFRNKKISWDIVEFYKFIISCQVFLNSILGALITQLIVTHALAVSLCMI